MVGDARELSPRGFGVQVRDALQGRIDFLVEQGLAERRGPRVVLVRNLLSTLRDRELASVGKVIQHQTWAGPPPTARWRARKRHLPPLSPARQRSLRHAGRRHGFQSGAVETSGGTAAWAAGSCCRPWVIGHLGYGAAAAWPVGAGLL